MSSANTFIAIDSAYFNGFWGQEGFKHKNRPTPNALPNTSHESSHQTIAKLRGPF